MFQAMRISKAAVKNDHVFDSHVENHIFCLTPPFTVINKLLISNDNMKCKFCRLLKYDISVIIAICEKLDYFLSQLVNIEVRNEV